MVELTPPPGAIKNAALWTLLVVTIVQLALQFIPVRSEMYWPINAIAYETSVWLLPLHAVGFALAVYHWRVVAPVFVIGMLFAVWPFVQVAAVKRDMMQQWSEAGLPQSGLVVPSGWAILWSSLTASAAQRVEPRALEMNIQLYSLARPAERRPVLINVHGGSWQFGSPTEDGAFASHMARKGYLVFSIDYRRAPEHRFPAQLEDVRAAIAWIAAHAAEFGGDAASTVLVGRSAGGHLSLLAAYADGAFPVRAVVSFYGPTDMAGIYENPSPEDPIGVRPKFEALLGGPPSQLAVEYREASPLTYVHDGLMPTLQIQGLRDRVVPAEYPRRFHEELRRHGTQALLLELPWSDHSFDFVPYGPGNLLALAYVESFLSQALGNEPASAGGRSSSIANTAAGMSTGRIGCNPEVCSH